MKKYIFSIILLISFLADCKREKLSDEDIIKGMILECKNSVEKQSVGEIVKYISKKYSDRYGNRKNDLHRFLAHHILGGNWVKVFTSHTKIEVSANNATVKMKVLLARGGKGVKIEDFLPHSSGTYRILLRLEKENSRFRVVEAEWESIGVSEMLEK